MSNKQTENLKITLEQLCATQTAYWAKDYVTILTRAAHWMAYFDLRKLNFAKAKVLKEFEY